MESGIIETTIITFQAFPEVVAYVGSFLAGEAVVLIIAFMAGQGIFNIATVFLWAFLGTITADSLWYFLGYYELGGWLQKKKYFRKKAKQIDWIFDTPVLRNKFLTILLTRFLYGTRVITILYLSRVKLHFLKFTILNGAATFIWISVMMTVGMLAGRGLSGPLEYVQNGQLILFWAALVVLLVFIVKRTCHACVIRYLRKQRRKFRKG